MRQFRNEDGPLAQLMAQQTQPSIPQAPTGSGILGDLMDNMGIDVEMSSSEAKGTEFKLRASEKPSVTQDNYDPMALWGDASAIVDQEYANMDTSMKGNPYDAAVGNLLASASQPIQDPSQMPVDPSGAPAPSSGFSQDVGLGTPMVQPPQNQPVQPDTGTLTPDGDSLENTSAGFTTVAKQAGSDQNSIEKTIASAGTAGKKVKKNNLMSGNEVTNDKILNKLGWDPERRHTNYLLEMATDMIGRYALMAMAKSQGATYEEALAMANSSHKRILEARAKQETFDEEKRVFDAVQEVFYSTGSYVDPGSQADVYDALMATGMVSPEEAQTISGYHPEQETYKEVYRVGPNGNIETKQVRKDKMTPEGWTESSGVAEFNAKDLSSPGYDIFFDARNPKAGITPYYVPKGEIGPEGTYPTESSAKLGFESMHGRPPGIPDTGTDGAKSDELLYLAQELEAARSEPNPDQEKIKLLTDALTVKRNLYLKQDKVTESQLNTIYKDLVYGQWQKEAALKTPASHNHYSFPPNSKFNDTNKKVYIDYGTLKQLWKTEMSPFKVIPPRGGDKTINFLPYNVMKSNQAPVSEMQNDARANVPVATANESFTALAGQYKKEFGQEAYNELMKTLTEGQ